jgi:hypothetical protein
MRQKRSFYDLIQTLMCLAGTRTRVRFDVDASAGVDAGVDAFLFWAFCRSIVFTAGAAGAGVDADVDAGVDASFAAFSAALTFAFASAAAAAAAFASAAAFQAFLSTE